MERYLEKSILKDLKKKVVFVSGPRQVGKITMSRQLIKHHIYLNYNSRNDRNIINSEEWDRLKPLIVFDEVHKKKWKSWIKGVYDTERIPPPLLVTGSACLDKYKKEMIY